MPGGRKPQVDLGAQWCQHGPKWARQYFKAVQSDSSVNGSFCLPGRLWVLVVKEEEGSC